jgi:hypothetical protein
MKANRGIALIASLLIMASIMALGLGSMFLTQMNLQIAENTRSNAIAKSNADAGIEVALIQIAILYENNAKTFPATVPASSLSILAGQSYRPEGGDAWYTWYDAEQARITIEGFTANNGSYIAEALLTAVAQLNPAFRVGLVSEASVRITGGGSALFINSGVHSNDGVTLTGFDGSNFKSCPLGYTDGSSCPNRTPTPASSSNSTCRLKGTLRCATNVDPYSVTPEYMAKRNEIIRKAHREGGVKSDANSTLAIMQGITPNNEMRCSSVHSNGKVFLSASDVQLAGPVICADGEVIFPSGVNMTGITVIAEGDVKFGTSSTAITGTAGNLTDVKLVSKQGAVRLNSVTGHNLSIFSARGNLIETSGQTSTEYFVIREGFKLTGDTTIASQEHVRIDNNTQITTKPATGTDAVTVSVISEKTIENNGSQNFYGVFWAGTGFVQKGSGTIFGSVAVKDGDINITGRLTVDSSYAIRNSTLNDPPRVSIASRR